jgi:hypothetical protein
MVNTKQVVKNAGIIQYVNIASGKDIVNNATQT